MQITYNAPTTVSRTVEVDESQLPILFGALRDCFLSRMQVFGISEPYFKFEEAAIEICRQSGVDPNDRIDVVNFFTALLKGDSKELREEGE